MRRVWITQGKGECVTLFFCGWGLDEHAIQHLEGTGDLLVFYDYRNISNEAAPVLEGYREIKVVAWSMGVWAASVLLDKWGIKPSSCVAVNGTERPIDEAYGIFPKVYLLTEQSMSERVRDRFFDRMLSGKEEFVMFGKNKPSRDLGEQAEELRRIREQAKMMKPEIRWDRVYISDHDVIFPVGNQMNWWRNRSEVISIESGHYPFYVLRNWDSI